MSLNAEWEMLYAAQRHLSIWPWSDLVSLVMRHLPPAPTRGKRRILELGCGVGANLPFLLSLGEVWAIDGSPTAVRNLHRRFPEAAERLLIADFSQPWPISNTFDIIVDRGSITCNSTSAIRRILDQVRMRLSKPDGLFFGVDFFSMEFSAAAEGSAVEDDIYSRRNFMSGRLSGTGLAHFADEAHLRDLFADFELIYLEHKVVEQRAPYTGERFAAWNLVTRPSP
jgi:SAM-dependent methyltransferase